MSRDKDAVMLYIEEQRRYHDELTQSNNSVRTKLITYIGAILAILAFLYSGALDAAKTATERLFIPDELYGKVFYFFGLFLVMYALGKLIHGSRPNGVWTVAMESSDVEHVETLTHDEYLVKLKNDYEKARRDNVHYYNLKYNALKDAFYPMLLGAILLVVLRYFQ